jgi:transmembrane sensor
MKEPGYIQQLLLKAQQQEATADELEELVQEIRNDADGGVTALIALTLGQEKGNYETRMSAEEWKELARKITTSDHEATPVIRLYHRVHVLRTAWFRYAAAVIIVLGVGVYLWNTQTKEKPSVTQVSPLPVKNDVAPGGNKAILTLADGSKIVLDSAQNGTIATQGNSDIVKRDGQVLYNKQSSADSRLPAAVAYNTMTTPRGGQYQLTLSDGTEVWLNAESSITYPTAFIGNERKVMVTGEAYFEVTHDKKKPFKVIVAPHASRLTPHDEVEIEVLGTRFNVNAYKEEPTINTTLLEGSVRLTLPTADSRLPTAEKTVLTLKPGQQGQLTDRGLFLAAHPDVAQVMAWKNGVFNFNNLSLEEVMRQLSRWYDVQVVYEGTVPKMTFGGKMGRDLNLSQVLKVLDVLGVKFRIEGKKLVVKS